jgi:hypothetical protein
MCWNDETVRFLEGVGFGIASGSPEFDPPRPRIR